MRGEEKLQEVVDPILTPEWGRGGGNKDLVLVMKASTNRLSHFNEKVENYQGDQISGAGARNLEETVLGCAGCKRCQERTNPES